MDAYLNQTESGLSSMEAGKPQKNFRSGWTREHLRASLKAFSLHLAISALAALCLSIPIVVWLYPSPFFEAAAGLHLLALILGVDVILGPSLTFLVFDQRKASLRKDLAIIACCQVLALGYGLYSTAMSRPLYMTFVVDRFETVSAAQVDDEELVRAPPELRQYRWGHPQVAYAEMPTNREERDLILFAAVHSGIDLRHMFRYYKPLEQGKPQIAAKARPLAELDKYNDPAEVARQLAPWTQGRKLAFVPLQGKKRDLTVLVDAADGSMVKVLDLKPWP